jgi:hypothetical protein
MRSVDQTTDRLAGRPVARRDFVRLVAAAMSLYQQHVVDHKGRCRIGTRRRRVRRIRTRPGTVYSVLNCYLAQPDELVQPE